MEETRYQRLAREQRERQQARQKRMIEDHKRQRRQRKVLRTDKIADRIDGYDRDDLGESPDF